MCSYNQFLYWVRKTVWSIDAIVFPPSIYANYEKEMCRETCPGPENSEAVQGHAATDSSALLDKVRGGLNGSDDTIYVLID